mmetsp:Transcript_51680/g.112334  ORF Transcript_51680/g.112334 Transcript_51680/m.112334 type:complete len:88 (-) Transcript_51680:619-882(-)
MKFGSDETVYLLLCEAASTRFVCFSARRRGESSALPHQAEGSVFMLLHESCFDGRDYCTIFPIGKGAWTHGASCGHDRPAEGTPSRL